MEESAFRVFDLQRMFIGDLPLEFLLEVAVRTSIMYLYALLVARLLGKRGMGQMTPFEYIIVIATGSATGDPMFYPEVPLLHGMVVLTTVVALQRGIETIARSHKKFRHGIEGFPAMLIRNGAIDEKLLSAELLTKDELFMQLRLQGVRTLEEVEYAFLEPSGRLSVFRRNGSSADGTSVLPPDTLPLS